LACSTRRVMTYWWGGSPVAALNSYLGQGRGGVEVFVYVLQDGTEPPARQGTIPPVHSAAGCHDVPD
jgi:hypothetical protein